MDGPRNYHANRSQSDGETPTSNAITYMWNLSGDSEKLMVSKPDRLGGRGMRWGFGVDMLQNWVVMTTVQL